MSIADSTRFACVGGGNVGRAWAIVFARAGFQVSLYDADSELLARQSLPAIRQSVHDLHAAGMLDDPERLMQAIAVKR